MVRLGVRKVTSKWLATMCFNSSMVRLGEYEKTTLKNHPGTFQFQYGSIGSPAHRVVLFRQRLVSIPVWFDWECNDETRRNTTISFNSSMVRLGGSPRLSTISWFS